MNALSSKMAHLVFDTLVKVCGALESDRISFVSAAIKPEFTEFRFGGHLGFGGKFWSNMGNWYVTCYNEDSTLEKNQIVLKANTLLLYLNEVVKPTVDKLF